MILDLIYTNKNLNIFNQVRSKLIYLLLGLSIPYLHIKCFCYLIYTLTSTKFIIGLMILTKPTFAQKKSLSCAQLVFYPHH